MENDVKCGIRWMIQRDLTRVIEIDSAAYTPPWTEEVFREWLNKRNVIPMVGECGGNIRGFMIYELRRTDINVVKFAVDPRQNNIVTASTMIDTLKGKLSAQRRTAISIMVPEKYLASSLFLKSHGFRASLVRGHYEDQDGLEFKYHHVSIPKVLQKAQSLYSA